MYPFRVCGRVVQIYRYSAEVVEEELITGDSLDDFEIIERKTTEYFISENEASLWGVNVIALDTSDYEWMDGLVVGESTNPYREAVKIYEMGEKAYTDMVNAPSAQEDIDAMMVDHEYRLTMLELGLV